MFVGVLQVRHYKSVKWVSTNETSFLMEFAAMKTFRRLYNYIQGANEKGLCIWLCVCVYVCGICIP